MTMPYTLDLNSLVKCDRNKSGDHDVSHLLWLNDKQAHLGAYYFLYGEYEQGLERYTIQVINAEEKAFDKYPEFRIVAEKALAEPHDDINKKLVELLYKNGAHQEDFEKDDLLIPGQIIVYYHANPAFDKNRIEIQNFKNGERKRSEGPLPDYVGMDKSCNIRTAIYYQKSGKILKRYEFHDNNTLCSIQQKDDKSPLRSASFDDKGNLDKILVEYAVRSKNFGSNYQSVCETLASCAQVEAAALQNNCKVIFDYNR